MRIAVCGSGTVSNTTTEKIAQALGNLISKNHVLLTGAGDGYPNSAAKAAFENNGEVIGYSPAKDEKEHTKKYGFPTDNFTKIIYTGKGIPTRNLDLIKASDAAIFIEGKVGTLNEFTLAYYFQKIIGVLTETGGISDKLKDIETILGDKKVIYSSNPKKLLIIMSRLSLSNKS